ncbi:transporter [Ganoderma sinense ZZ0214-1]|uniref:Transporter n=1 Tax=Ganoderma sinense ZZ0214-1 TaxID=1077348 RepID=A0A2G8SNS9_9APHY|nr:transporter [Ganoderma sinense ZZ0214-1]
MDEEQTRLLQPTVENLASVKVFPLIPSLKKDIVSTVDTALTWEQLTASDINFAIVRPLVFKYSRLDNMAVVYACFVVRSHFLSEAEDNLAFSGVLLSRAALCEILAMKLLGTFASSQLRVATVLTASWNPLAGASEGIIEEVKSMVGVDGSYDPQCALEMAIATESKAFLASPLVQTVVNDIYSGRMVFSMTSKRSVLADNYKPRSIEVYDVRKAPFLDHYRLRVPRYGATLEFINFALLLMTFLLCLSTKDLNTMNTFEKVFIVFAAAFALEEYTASKEHGWTIYIANLWNVFDSSFIVIFLVYLGYRLKGLHTGDAASSDFAFDVLACGACILFPRLAFFAVSNNVVVLALRSMMAEFLFFIGIAAICFSGLLFTLHNLSAESGRWSVKSIAWLMVQIWFGNTYLSFAQAESFHPIFGPVLMTMFAALSNTLLLTILISILSNTFARIDANAKQEYLFQYAISTIEGVKDTLFSYQPPFNMLAFAVLWPLSFVLSPRALHSTNVFLIKLTSFPQLIVIAIYERFLARGQKWRTASSERAHNLYNSFSRSVKHMPLLDLLGSSTMDVHEAIFDVDLHGSGDEDDLFADDDQEHADGLDHLHDFPGLGPTLKSTKSHDSLSLRPRSPLRPSGSHTPPPPPAADQLRRTTSMSLSPRKSQRSRTPRRSAAVTPVGGLSPTSSPRPRGAALPAINPPSAGEVPSVGQRSPLEALFGSRRERVASVAGVEAGVKRMEAMVEEMKRMPVNRLKEEMKELQERQARIENLLMMLTRGMRNDTGHPSSIRHDTL